MDISVRTTGPFGVEDRSWLGSAHGTTATRTITLDPAAFTAGTHFPKGYVPSGTVLARISATGLYGPYANGGAGGLEVAKGHLFNSTPMRTGGPKVGAPLLEHGVVNVSNLPANHGLDTAARADMAGSIIYRD